MLYRIKRHLFSLKTKFQHLRLLNTYSHGIILILDGRIQSALSDEYIYHEALVHPVMVLHSKPEHILILGGGEGAALREVLKHQVKDVVMVDIDRELIEFSKKHLKKWHQGSFFDKRAKVIFSDAMSFIKDTNNKFDVIISDISDPTEGSHAQNIYTREFFSLLRKRLTPQGIFITQATEVFYNPSEVFSIIVKTVSSAFPHIKPYMEYLPSFSSLWGFVIGSKGQIIPNKELIRERLKQKRIKTRYYNEDTHLRIFSLPKPLLQKIQRQKKVATIKDPISVFHI